MSQKRLTLSMTMGKKKRSFWPWILAGIAILIAIIILCSLNSNDEDDYLAELDPIDIESISIKEWDQLAELTRQSMEDDVSDGIPDMTEEKNTDPFLIRGKIKRNQTLFVALKNNGLDVSDIHQVIDSMQNVVDFKKSKPGDRYEVHLDVDHRILKFIYEISPEDISISERTGNEYSAHKVDVHKRVERRYVTGEVTSSLYQSFIDLGESGELASHFMRLFKYDIDFGMSSQRGDSFSVLVDRVTLNGEFYRYGRVWAATYTSGARGRTLEAFYYDSDSEFAGYYNAEGQALKKNYLKTPVVGCPVSSPFDPKRFHPVLKRIRPHNGIDWACPTGTPIMAFADGIVTFADKKGGNGNLLVIEHAHGYISLYAHLYGFATGIQKGSKVKQGQIVAMVGNTGISTGPHLHFAVKLNGKYLDPSKIDTSYSISLTGNHLRTFIQSRDSFRQAMTQQESAQATKLQ